MIATDTVVDDRFVLALVVVVVAAVAVAVARRAVVAVVAPTLSATAAVVEALLLGLSCSDGVYIGVVVVEGRCEAVGV